MWRAIGTDSWIVVPIASAARPGHTMEGTRLTLVLSLPPLFPQSLFSYASRVQLPSRGWSTPWRERASPWCFPSLLYSPNLCFLRRLGSSCPRAAGAHHGGNAPHPGTFPPCFLSPHFVSLHIRVSLAVREQGGRIIPQATTLSPQLRT